MPPAPSPFGNTTRPHPIRTKKTNGTNLLPYPRMTHPANSLAFNFTQEYDRGWTVILIRLNRLLVSFRRSVFSTVCYKGSAVFQPTITILQLQIQPEATAGSCPKTGKSRNEERETIKKKCQRKRSEREDEDGLQKSL